MNEEVTGTVNTVRVLRLIGAGERLLPIAIALGLLVTPGCRSSKDNQPATTREVIVTAPASGTVRALLVNDDATVTEGASILEIAIQPEPVDVKPSGRVGAERSQERARADLAVAEVEATRAAEKVNQIKPLVARGYAAKADLDSANASYQDAQARLQRARDNVQSAEKETSAAATNSAATISVVAPVAGRVRIISALLPGQSVVAGQQLFALVIGT
jgi:multidrug resistance efflux pump